MKRVFFICAILVSISVLATGCDLPRRFRYLTDPPESGDVLFFDDFSARASWDTWNEEQSIVDYSSGGLRFFINQPNYDYWSILDEYFEDTKIDVDVSKVNGPEDNSFGVLCRYKNQKNYYQFLVSSDGYFGIVKVLDGQRSVISSEQLQYDEVIVSGNGGLNHIQAVCLGSSLTLSINGVLLASAYDTDLIEGKVGLAAGTNAERAVDVLFDNFRVTQP